MEIKLLSVHPNAKLPKQGKPGDAAFDIFCVEDISLFPGETKAITTGLVLADMPTEDRNGNSIFLQIVGRSGLALKGIFPVGGIVDATYRGEIKAILHNGNLAHSYGYDENGNITSLNESKLNAPFQFKAGDRIAQILIQTIVTNQLNRNDVEMCETNRISETARGSSGFGSTGA